MKTYGEIKKIPYLGPESDEPFAFKYYDPDELVCGKPMREQLKFALSYWHTINASGTDMFGGDTMDKNFGKSEPMERYRAKADFAFELMDKLGLDYYCFHDVDIAPEGATLAESLENFRAMVGYIRELQERHGKKCLWVTANNFGDKSSWPERQRAAVRTSLPLRRRRSGPASTRLSSSAPAAMCSGAGARATRPCSTRTWALNWTTLRASWQWRATMAALTASPATSTLSRSPRSRLSTSMTSTLQPA